MYLASISWHSLPNINLQGTETEKLEVFSQNVSVAKRGGKVAGDARKAIENGTGKPIITIKKASELNHVVTQMVAASVKEISGKSETVYVSPINYFLFKSR